MMQPAVVEGLSLPPLQFFCYKNFLTGIVKVKINNFDSILRNNHVYPLKKLKLLLKPEGSCLFLEKDKDTKSKTNFDLTTIEKVTPRFQSSEIDIDDQSPYGQST